LEKKVEKLEEILEEINSGVVAFSGGADSSYLLYKAKECWGENLLAVTAALEVQTAEELELAGRAAQEIGAKQAVVHLCLLTKDEFTANSPERCYHCKRELFHRCRQLAAGRGWAVVCDGANADDLKDFRPGSRAAAELQVRSPLQEAGLTKQEVRLLSKQAGLGAWNLPASPCLATRLPYGEKITAAKLQMIAAAEKYLRSRGHTVLRVRCHRGLARIEVPPEKIPALLPEKEALVVYLQGLGFSYVTLDLQGFRSGSMNEML
jgi:uncharacterized protein